MKPRTKLNRILVSKIFFSVCLDFNKLTLIAVLILFCKDINANVYNSLRSISLLTRQYTIATSDLNKDGFPDLIIGGRALGTELGKIRVLLGKGNGNFQEPVEYVVGFNQSELVQSRTVEEIKIADMNDDGNLDVIVAHNQSRSQFNDSRILVSILFGNGDGTLEVSAGFIFESGFQNVSVRSIDIYDMDNDGDLDVLVGC